MVRRISSKLTTSAATKQNSQASNGSLGEESSFFGEEDSSPLEDIQSSGNSEIYGINNENSSVSQQIQITTTATNTQTKAAKPRKQLMPKQNDNKFWMEVLNLQCTTNNLIPRLPFSRLVREIISNYTNDVTRITLRALEALQAASEMYLTQTMQDAYLLTLHRGRVTLDAQDMALIRLLRAQM